MLRNIKFTALFAAFILLVSLLASPTSIKPTTHITTVADMQAMGWTYTPPEENPVNKLLARGPVDLPTLKKAAVNGCVDSAFCLYQWLNFGAGKWQTSYANILLHTNNCITITPAVWPNGTPVSDNSGSMISNGNSFWPADTYYGVVYDSGNCNSGAGSAGWNTDRVNTYPDLRNVLLLVGTNAYHKISSVAIRCLSGLPC